MRDGTVFSTKLDMLIYMTFATKPVTANDVIEDVVSFTSVQVNRTLKEFVDLGFATRKRISNVNYYTATDKAKQLFGG